VYKKVIEVLLVLVLMVGCFIAGQEYERANVLDTLYGEYFHIQMYEDGSYTGEDFGGKPVSGCIEGALCND